MQPGVALLAALTAVAPRAEAEDAPTVAQGSSDKAAASDLASAPVLSTVPKPAGFDLNRPTPGAKSSAALPAPAG